MADPDPPTPLPAEALEEIRGRASRVDPDPRWPAFGDRRALLVEVDRLRAQVRRLQAAEDVIEAAWSNGYDPDVHDLAEALGLTEETDDE